MKRKLCLLLILVLLSAAALTALETQFSFGMDYNFGFLDLVSNFWEEIPTSGGISVLPPSYNVYSEKTEGVFVSPGLSFTMRLLLNPDPGFFLQSGYFIRGRVLVGSRMERTGSITRNNVSRDINEELRLGDEELVLVVGDVGFGTSYILRPANRLHFCFELGINYSMITFEHVDSGSSFDYRGLGFLFGMSTQIYFTQRVYLELGLNTLLGIFSSIEGTHIAAGGREINYTEGGRWDMASFAPFVHIGWRNILR